jgi:hypothetical protein
VVVRVTKVSVVEKPHIADIKNLVVWAIEEALEVLDWLQEIGEPDQSRKIRASSLNESTSQLNLISLILVGGL